MKRAFLAACACLCAAVLAQDFPPAAASSIGPEARWSPPAGFVERTREECSPEAAADPVKCFSKLMREAGASEEASAFAASLPMPGFMSEFRKAGHLGVAYVVYPFRANENLACLLTSGTSPLIDVDEGGVPKPELEADPAYAALLREHPDVAVFPGDRTAKARLALHITRGGAQTLAFGYRLNAGCHACETLAMAELGFEFDANGAFLRRKLLKIEPSGGSKDSQMIHATAGKEFQIRLESNPTTGYGWQLAAPLDAALLEKAGSEYVAGEASGRLGAGGTEVWTFRALKKGKAVVRFKYVRSWEKEAPAKAAVYIVLIESER